MLYYLLNDNGILYQILEFFLLIYIILLGVIVILFAATIIGLWKIFDKAGVSGWHSLVPLLNIYDLYNTAWNKNAAVIAVVVSVVDELMNHRMLRVMRVISDPGAETNHNSEALNILIGIIWLTLLVMHIICMYKLSEAFGHGDGFFCGLILAAPVFLCIIGFGKSQYMPAERNDPHYEPYDQIYDPSSNLVIPEYDPYSSGSPYRKDNILFSSYDTVNENPFSENNEYSEMQNPFEN